MYYPIIIKITLSGLAGAIATYLMDVDDPAWLAAAGKALMALSVFFPGKNARDRDVPVRWRMTLAKDHLGACTAPDDQPSRACIRAKISLLY